MFENRTFKLFGALRVLMHLNEKLDVARQILTDGDPSQALVLFEQIADMQPERSLQRKALIGSCHALMKLGRIEQSTDIAQKALEQSPEDYSVLLINAECAKLAGRNADEETFYRHAFAAAPDRLITAKPLCQKLLATNQLADVQEVCDIYVELTGDRAPLLSSLARKQSIAGDASAALALWHEIYVLPGTPASEKRQALTQISECLVQLEAYSELRKLFDSTAETGPERPAILLGMPSNPNPEGMQYFPTKLLRETADKNPQRPAAETAYNRRLREQGTLEAFREIADRQFERRSIVRTGLREQIAAISVQRNKINSTPELLNFWNLCGKPYGNLNDWLVASQWESQANDLLRMFTFLEIEEEDQIFEQVSDITVPPDYALIHEALEQGKGCLLAGSHLGPVWAHAFLTSRHFDNLGIIGGKPRPRLGIGNKDVAMRIKPLQARRDIQKYLSQNAIMWCGPDSVHKSDAKNLFDSAFGPLPVQISYAHIQFRTGAPGVWSERYWKQKKIHIAHKKMPSPEPDEGLKDFTRRWCETYLAFLTDLIRHRLANSQFAHVIGRGWTY